MLQYLDSQAALKRSLVDMRKALEKYKQQKLAKSANTDNYQEVEQRLSECATEFKTQSQVMLDAIAELNLKGPSEELKWRCGYWEGEIGKYRQYHREAITRWVQQNVQDNLGGGVEQVGRRIDDMNSVRDSQRNNHPNEETTGAIPPEPPTLEFLIASMNSVIDSMDRSLSDHLTKEVKELTEE